MEKKGNSKLVWYILFSIVTVVLCYLFAVVYFYFISPYNISLKIGFWPFLSDEKVAAMYTDATCEINFTVKNEEFEEEEKNVLGVNVRKDGYIVAPYSDFANATEQTNIKIFSTSGKTFYGKLLFADKDYDLAILKAENSTDGQDEISLPFVSVASISSIVEGNEVIAINDPVSNNQVLFGSVYDTDYGVPTIAQKDGLYIVDRFQECCFAVEISSFSGGAIFDKKASLLGFSYGKMTETTEENVSFVLPAEAIKFVLEDVVKAYQSNSTFENELRDKLVGLDQMELDYFMECSQNNVGDEANFYFNKAWHSYSAEISYYASIDRAGYFLMNDFVHNGVTIGANCAIIALRIDSTTHKIEDKYGLFEIVYNLKKGSSVTIFYEIYENDVSQSKNVTITV